MNLNEQDELIEALIIEAEDYTIKDFLELKAKIENIKEKAPENETYFTYRK